MLASRSYLKAILDAPRYRSTAIGCSSALRREQGYSDEQEAVLDIAFSFEIYTLLLPIYTHTRIPQFENHAVWKTVILAAETLLKQLAK